MIDRPVLFLDIDGVLNSEDWHKREAQSGEPWTPTRQLDHACILRLRELIRMTSAVIVVSSAWRFDTVSETRRYLREFGICPGSWIVGVTPRFAHAPRGEEIAGWLRMHPEVTTYAIVDDETDMAHLGDRLVQTDRRYGLSDANVEGLRLLLEVLPLPTTPAEKATQTTLIGEGT